MTEMPFESTPSDIKFVRDRIRFGGSVFEQIEQDIPGRFSMQDGDRLPFPHIILSV